MAAWIEHETQVLVIGGGIAGALAVARAQEQGARVLLVDKSAFGRSGCSAVASGVFHVSLPGDDPELFRSRRGGSLVHKDRYESAEAESFEVLKLLDTWGVRWIKRDGKLVRVRAPGLPSPQEAMLEGGGPQLMMAIRAEILRRGIEVLERVMITDLLTSDGQWPTQGAVVGAVGFHRRTGEMHVFRAACTVVCTGPMKYPYASPEQVSSPSGSAGTGMPRDLSGDGLAMGYRVGCALGKMEMGGGGLIPQYLYSAPGMEMFTGLGAIYRNRDGQSFLEDYDPVNKGFASRSDIVNAVRRELSVGRGPIHLDCRHFTDEQVQLLRVVVPIIMRNFDAAGYELARDLIPYISQFPTTQQTSGAGMVINDEARTGIPGLFAAGNTTDGAYSSMTQALPGAAATGRWAGLHAGQEAVQMPVPAVRAEQCERARATMMVPLQRAAGLTFRQVSDTLFRVIEEDIGLVMDGSRMQRAMERVAELRDEAATGLAASDPHELVKVHSICNYLDALVPTLAVMLHREESRGNVLRSDYPYIDNERFFCYTRVRCGANGQPLVWDEPVPEETVFTYPPKTKVAHRFFAEEGGELGWKVE